MDAGSEPLCISAFGNLLASWSLPHSSSSLSVSVHFRLCTDKSMPFATAGTQALSKPDRQQAQSVGFQPNGVKNKSEERSEANVCCRSVQHRVAKEHSLPGFCAADLGWLVSWGLLSPWSSKHLHCDHHRGACGDPFGYSLQEPLERECMDEGMGADSRDINGQRKVMEDPGCRAQQPGLWSVGSQEWTKGKEAEWFDGCFRKLSAV